MKLTHVKCANCGAPVRISSEETTTQCSHCQSYLAVELNDSAFTTTRLSKLENSTEALETELDEVKRELDLERLDREWERERQQFAERRKDGRQVMPSRNGANLAAVLALVMAIFAWTIAGSLYNKGVTVKAQSPPPILREPIEPRSGNSIFRDMERDFANDMRRMNYDFSQRSADNDIKFSRYFMIGGVTVCIVGLTLRHIALRRVVQYESALHRYQSARQQITQAANIKA